MMKSTQRMLEIGSKSFSVEDPTLVAASPDPDDNRIAYWTNQGSENPPEFNYIYDSLLSFCTKIKLLAST